MNKIDSFGNRLASALKERKMKQVELCEKTGIGKSSLSQYLSGEYEPRSSRVYVFANALQVSSAWLMGYDVPMEYDDPLYMNLRDIADSLPDGTYQIKKEVIDLLGGLSKDQLQISFSYLELNSKGQQRLKEYLKELLSIKEYTQIEGDTK